MLGRATSQFMSECIIRSCLITGGIKSIGSGRTQSELLATTSGSQCISPTSSGPNLPKSIPASEVGSGCGNPFSLISKTSLFDMFQLVESSVLLKSSNRSEYVVNFQLGL